MCVCTCMCFCAICVCECMCVCLYMYVCVFVLRMCVYSCVWMCAYVSVLVSVYRCVHVCVCSWMSVLNSVGRQMTSPPSPTIPAPSLYHDVSLPPSLLHRLPPSLPPPSSVTEALSLALIILPHHESRGLVGASPGPLHLAPPQPCPGDAGVSQSVPGGDVCPGGARCSRHLKMWVKYFTTMSFREHLD